MFTIDLLKGQGLPTKSKPEGIAIATAAFVVPVLVAIIIFGFYLHNRIVMSIQKEAVVNYQAKIDKFSDTVELQKSFEQEKNLINSCLSEVASSLGGYTQWSSVLATLVRNMPDTMVLTELEVKQDSIKKKVPHKDNPQIKVDISVPVRTLKVNVCGHPQSNCDRAVRDFRDRLRSSTVLGSKLEDIRVSQRFSTLGGEDVVSYEIDCIFKAGL